MKTEYKALSMLEQIALQDEVEALREALREALAHAEKRVAGIDDKRAGTPRMIINFPWPPSELSPNKRLHWSKTAPITANYRHAGRIITLQAMSKFNVARGSMRLIANNEIHLFIDFYPPNRRRRDDDNVFSSFKACRDGISAALGIDDSHFRTRPFLHHEIVKNGLVVVTLSTSQKRKNPL